MTSLDKDVAREVLNVFRFSTTAHAAPFYRTLACLMLSAFSMQALAYDYDEALSTFRRGNVGLWLKSSLPDKMAKLNSGVAVVVFEELWKEGRSVVECDFWEKKCRIHKSDNSTAPLTKDEFREMCEASALVSYGDNVYLNIPTDSATANETEDVLGAIMAGGLYDIAKELLPAMPKRKVRVRFVSQGNPDLLLKDCSVSNALTRAEVATAVREMLETVCARNWKCEHAAKVKKLPRKPPVVYGNGKNIIKHSDGTFEIPREAPPTSKTITWWETVYADGWGTLDSGEHFSMRVPVGERKCTRVKPLTQMYDYEELKAKLEAYEEAVEELKNDRPPVVDDAMVENVIRRGHFKFSTVKQSARR